MLQEKRNVVENLKIVIAHFNLPFLKDTYTKFIREEDISFADRTSCSLKITIYKNDSSRSLTIRHSRAIIRVFDMREMCIHKITHNLTYLQTGRIIYTRARC